jgi:hypothetical protein
MPLVRLRTLLRQQLRMSCLARSLPGVDPGRPVARPFGWPFGFGVASVTREGRALYSQDVGQLASWPHNTQPFADQQINRSPDGEHAACQSSTAIYSQPPTVLEL